MRDGTKLTAAVIFALVIVAVVVGALYLSSRHMESACTVDSKDRAVKISTDSDGHSSSSTDYRVYTSCGVFEVTDNVFLLKFNSADTYASLKEGKTYDMDVVGWRIGFFSLFPNVLGVEAK